MRASPAVRESAARGIATVQRDVALGKLAKPLTLDGVLVILRSR